MNLKLMLLVSGAFCICAEGSHKLCFVYGCFDSSDTQVYMTLDDDEIVYFKKDSAVWDSKIPTSFRPEAFHVQAKKFQQLCKTYMSGFKPDTSVIKTKNPPDIEIFPRNEAVVHKENTLICFINKFFPPEINITWTKNDEIISTEEDPFIKTVSNSDGLFHVFSYLSFVPKDGDIYSCTVEHAALEKPKTRVWDLKGEEHKKISGSDPAVFFGIAVTLGTLGLFGIAAGTFFFVKGQKTLQQPVECCD